MRRIWPLLRLLATLAAIALVATGCGDDESEGDDRPPAGSADARSLLATAASKQIDSADIALRLAADIPGFPVLGSRLVLTASGPIVWEDSRDFPKAKLNLLLRAGGQGFSARVVAVEGRAYVQFQGFSYEVDPKTMGRILDPGDGSASKPGKPGVSLEELGIDPSGWIAKARVEDGDEIGGDSTRVVTGTVDVRAVLDDIGRLVDSEALSGERLDKAEQAIKKVEVEVNVDDEGYPRRLFAELDFVTPEDVKDPAFEGGKISFELILGELGVDVSPHVPESPRPLSELIDFASLIFDIDQPSDLWTIQR